MNSRDTSTAAFGIQQHAAVSKPSSPLVSLASQNLGEAGVLLLQPHVLNPIFPLLFQVCVFMEHPR